MTRLATLAVTKLLTYVAAGELPEIYTDVKDWLYDFWPDLSWTADRDNDIHDIIKCTEFPQIRRFFQDKYNFNFEAELKSGLTEGPVSWRP